MRVHVDCPLATAHEFGQAVLALRTKERAWFSKQGLLVGRVKKYEVVFMVRTEITTTVAIL